MIGKRLREEARLGSTTFPHVRAWRALIGLAGATLAAALLLSIAPGAQTQEGGTPTECTTGIKLSATPTTLSEGASTVEIVITAEWVSGTDTTSRTVAYTIAFPTGVTTSPTTLTGNVTIPAMDSSSSAVTHATLTLTGLDNTVIDPGRRIDITGTVSGLPNPCPATIPITDNDNRVTLALSSGGSALSEVDEGFPTQVTVTASLPSGTTAPTSNTDLTITVGGGSGDTATSGTDFDMVPPFTLTIPANMLSGTHDFNLVSLNTIPFRGSKSLTVSGSSTGFVVNGAQLTINDQTTVTLSLRSGGSALSSVVEGSTTQVTVRASLPSGATVSTSASDLTITVGGVAGDTAAAGTDFDMVPPFTLTIPANMLSGTHDFNLVSLNTIPTGSLKRLTVSSSTTGIDVTGAQLTITARPETPTGPTGPTETVPPSPPPPPPPPSSSTRRPPSPSVDEQTSLTLADTLPDWSACLGPARRSTRFTDVADWDADPAIRCATYYRITVGRTPTLFAPTEEVPRWQMALFMYRALGPAGVDTPAESDQGFTDLGGLSEEARRAANAVAQLGIMPGAGKGRFDPQGLVSRRSMALILHSFLQSAVLQTGVTLGGDSAATGFTDLGGLSTAERRAVGGLYALGVVRGAAVGTFAPDDTVTRVQMMRLIARALAYTIVRPAGVSMQTDRDTAVERAVDLVISVRDTDFLPVSGARVDIFFARDAGDAFSDSGRCVTGLLSPLAGSQVCQVDRGDPATGPVGDLRMRITGIISGQRVWAWSGAEGVRVTDLVRFARLMFVL